MSIHCDFGNTNDDHNSRIFAAVAFRTLSKYHPAKGDSIVEKSMHRFRWPLFAILLVVFGKHSKRDDEWVRPRINEYINAACLPVVCRALLSPSLRLYVILFSCIRVNWRRIGIGHVLFFLMCLCLHLYRVGLWSLSLSPLILISFF